MLLVVCMAEEKGDLNHSEQAILDGMIDLFW